MSFQVAQDFASKYGWHQIGNIKDPYMVSFAKTFNGHPGRINVWVSEKGNVTVGTYITHPKKGKSQLFRKHVNTKTLESIFKNPRVHTKLGYSRR